MSYVRKATWIEYGPGPAGSSSTAPPAVLRPAKGRGWARRRGVGDQGVPYASYCANASLWNPIAWSVCLPADVNAVASKIFGSGSVPAPPSPAAPSISAVAATTPGAVYGGTDANGNPIYLLPQSAADNMASYDQTVSQFMDQVGAANPPPDCSTFWNSTFNSACPSKPGNSVLLIGGALVLTVLVVGMMKGGR